MCTEDGFTLSCWKTHGCPLYKQHLEDSKICSKILMYISAIMFASQMCNVANYL